jgi:pyrroline-5-carboxylate reductase
MKKISFLGAGNMAEAIISGVLAKGLFQKEDLIVSDVSNERLKFFYEKFGVTGVADNVEAARVADVIILAVKPDVAVNVLKEIAGIIGSQLLISIAAGITTRMIEDAIGKAIKVIRVMPNSAALVGRGAAAYCSGKYATRTDEEAAEKIMGAVGFVCRIEENYLNAVTALSGSGPAYVFYLAEAMIEAGIKMQLSEEKVYELVAHTIAGAGELLLKSRGNPALLRAKVTSKGGTTEAAMKVLDSAHVKKNFETAILAAERRAKELAK